MTLATDNHLRPRLKRTIERFDLSDGHVYLLRGGGQPDWVIRDASALERDLLAALDGAGDVGAVAAGLRARGHEASEDDVLEAVAGLHEAGLVEDAAADGRAGLPALALERFDRQLAYFGDVGAPGLDRADCQARLAGARVTVIGLGGLGSWALYALAASGVGRLDAIDSDRVELSNLNRQILYGEDDLSELKAPAAARAVARFNRGIDVRPVARRLESRADVEEEVAGADFVVEAADWPVHEISRWVNAACVALGVPHVSASQFPPLVRIGPTYLPGETGCFECQEHAWRRELPLYDEIAAARRARPSPAATFGPACGLIGSAVAMEAVHHLSGVCPPATLGRACILDVRTLEQRWEPVERVAGCPVCG